MTSVTRNKNRIQIGQMGHTRVVDDFIRCMNHGYAKGYRTFQIQFSDVNLAYPNVCIPIAGILEYYQEQGVEFEFAFKGSTKYLKFTRFHQPLSVSENLTELKKYPFDNTWKFNDSEDVQNLVDSLVREVSQIAVCETGVLDGLTWCLNEVMDNVLQHSQVGVGYVMGQVHSTTKHIAFCVFDYGQGIYNSLKATEHSPRFPVDAITLSIKEGITRDKKIGQGNGMWGLHNIVKSNAGTLMITSNGAAYLLKDNSVRTFPNLPYLTRQNGCTTIDFQIDYDKGISITDSLGGYTPLNLRTYSLEDERGRLIYKLADKASGTGTRQSGERLRHEIINLYNDAESIIEIDFSEVSVVSSSFADELIGKLVTEYGFSGFTHIFRLRNMNTIVQSIVNRSVSQRMAESFVTKKD